MGPANRQDVQNIVDIARNRILERTVTKQDLTVLSEAVRNLMNMQQQSQQMLKQGEYQRLQFTRRAVALEARMALIENELRGVQQALTKLAGQKPEKVIMPMPAPASERPIAQSQASEYAYPTS
jgi:hypothetical protein